MVRYISHSLLMKLGVPTFSDVDYKCSRNGRDINPLPRKVLDLETRMRRRLEKL